MSDQLPSVVQEYDEMKELEEAMEYAREVFKEKGLDEYRMTAQILERLRKRTMVMKAADYIKQMSFAFREQERDLEKAKQQIEEFKMRSV